MEIILPNIGETVDEGKVIKWLKQVGDQVDEGDVLCEVETDKSTMEFESFQEGFLLHIGVKENETAQIDSVLAILGKKGETIKKIRENSQNQIKKILNCKVHLYLQVNLNNEK